MECLIISDTYLQILPSHHLDYMKTNNKYSIAFGTEGGKFKAAYFSLNGSAKAIDFAISINSKLIDEEGTSEKTKYNSEAL